VTRTQPARGAPARTPRETAKSKQAWADYVALGPDRSLEKLAAHYQERRRQRRGRKASVPTTRVRTLFEWSRVYGWQQRLQDIADREVKEAEEREAAHIREILESGYALPHERVALLKRLIEPLVADLSGDRRWLKDFKWIGGGESGEKVEIERFNAAEFDQLRGLLDDIAKEKGERIKRTELTGKDGQPLEVAVSWAQAVEGVWQRGGPGA
jgi:hypothetical protein